LATLGSDTLEALRWSAVVAPLLPTLIGGGLWKQFKEWTYTEKEMIDRVWELQERLTESLTSSHTRLLEAVNAGHPLRGEPPRKPDYVSDHSSETRRVIRLMMSLEFLKLETSAGYGALLLSVILSVVLFFGGVLLLLLHPTDTLAISIIFGSILLVVLQLATVLWLRFLCGQLDRLNEHI